MNFLKAIKKLITHLTKGKDTVRYYQSSVQKEVEIKTSSEKEESILEKTIENPYVSQVRDWAVKKIEFLHEADRHRNAKALAAEFDEWINISEEVEELEYFCLENEDWTDEQEIDVR